MKDQLLTSLLNMLRFFKNDLFNNNICMVHYALMLMLFYADDNLDITVKALKRSM